MKRLLCFLLLPALLLATGGCGGSRGADSASVTFFQAGKADAAVVRTEDAVLLVDTGLKKNAGELVDALKATGVAAIDVLILSHFDKDHVGGAADILRSFPVGAVYQSNYPKDSDEYAAYLEALAEAGVEPVTVSDSISLSLGGLEIAIDGPDEAEYADDPSNNSSLVTAVTWSGGSLLFAGDAQDARLTELLADYTRPAGTLILKVPYHGHWQRTLPDFLAAASPDVAVISCGKNEPDEDELAATTELLESLGAKVYRTSAGDVTILLAPDGASVVQ